ncbi:MAG: sigma-70 family RNA polymerase sigma factor [Cyclobacteriaceae bacterium]|nr:sigma-70 family RNA polymerase sigma factor [Cyclobacteriaceae bacterium]MDW8330991.1 sigma-70 family RNA polymerase sigma factor [Cyclobacteriaceae bacterium]
MLPEDEVRREYEILARARKEPEAFGELYEKYFDRIFGFIFRQTDDEELTADLTSQTFLNALNNLNNFEYRGVPVSAWLYRIAANEVNKYYRKKNRTRIFSLEEIKIKELIELGTDDWDEELLQRMLTYLKDLPTEMLEVLELRFFEDKDFKEIAYILGITESGAKMRTYRALDRLRKKFNLKIKYDG